MWWQAGEAFCYMPHILNVLSGINKLSVYLYYTVFKLNKSIASTITEPNINTNPMFYIRYVTKIIKKV